MRRAVLIAVAVAASVPIFSLRATAATVDAPVDARIVVRSYDSSALPENEHATSIAVATAILESAGLTVAWRVCHQSLVRPNDDPCDAPLHEHELAIRYVTMAPALTLAGDGALGYSHVDTEKRKGALATIFVRRVLTLASVLGIDPGTLLGRASAHEIGHLLLGTTSHAHVGLMRAVWTQDVLRQGQADDWLFTVPDSQALQDAVRARGRQ